MSYYGYKNTRKMTPETRRTSANETNAGYKMGTIHNMEYYKCTGGASNSLIKRSSEEAKLAELTENILSSLRTLMETGSKCIPSWGLVRTVRFLQTTMQLIQSTSIEQVTSINQKGFRS
jgi:hypothetical protein